MILIILNTIQVGLLLILVYLMWVGRHVFAQLKDLLPMEEIRSAKLEDLTRLAIEANHKTAEAATKINAAIAAELAIKVAATAAEMKISLDATAAELLRKTAATASTLAASVATTAHGVADRLDTINNQLTENTAITTKAAEAVASGGLPMPGPMPVLAAPVNATEVSLQHIEENTAAISRNTAKTDSASLKTDAAVAKNTADIKALKDKQ